MSAHLTMLLWLLFIVIEVALNFWAIEEKRRDILHCLWFIPRVLVGLCFLKLFYLYGYIWYWTGFYLIGTHMLVFPELLNAIRGKPVGYLGDPNLDNPNKSTYDKLILEITGQGPGLAMWFYFRVFIFISVVSIMLFYGDMTWNEINGY